MGDREIAAFIIPYSSIFVPLELNRPESRHSGRSNGMVNEAPFWKAYREHSIVFQIGLEGIEIDRRHREIRIADQPFQQGLTLRQDLLRQHVLKLEYCLNESGYLCHDFSPPLCLKSNPMSSSRSADFCASTTYNKRTPQNAHSKMMMRPASAEVWLRNPTGCR